MATRAIAATQKEKEANIGELREVEGVVGTAVVEGSEATTTQTARTNATLKFQIMSHHWQFSKVIHKGTLRLYA